MQHGPFGAERGEDFGDAPFAGDTVEPAARLIVDDDSKDGRDS